MSIQDIAADLIAKCKALKFQEIGEKYWADDVVSIEAGGPPGMDPTTRGKANVRGKGEWWANAHETHSCAVEGPYINGDQFAVRFTMDVTVKESGQKMNMVEIGLYTVKDDKITEEKFFYGG